MFALTFLIPPLILRYVSDFNLYKRSQLAVIKGKIMQRWSRSKKVCEKSQIIMIAITFNSAGR
ncbi:hypothetical protein HMPREF1570_4343 [Klebsiella oxytoca KA-2]|nr:hypothetical protein HMPREF1570_4343 [Klebsiella oxytoca KA-2]